MSTLRQIEANRRNAQQSTGPRSAEGKARARFNALKTGINAKSEVIPGENVDDLDVLAANYHLQFQPATPLECFLVDSLINADWQLRRLRRMEARLWAQEMAGIQDSSRELNEDPPLGTAFSRGRDVFTRLHRRIDAVERSYFRALKELKLLVSATPEQSVEELPSEPDPAELGSFCQNPAPQSAAGLEPSSEIPWYGKPSRRPLETDLAVGGWIDGNHPVGDGANEVPGSKEGGNG